MPLHRRLPKLKGFSNSRFKITYQVVNLHRLAELYPDGGDVTPEPTWRPAARAGVASWSRSSARARRSAALRVTAHAFSASAIEKITAAGGTRRRLAKMLRTGNNAALTTAP